ncbi:DNA polymerase domain-containing protein [Sulfurisphaera tokodaii]|uniref:DNA-directed DNA polymerase n=2 Tax=Sulfurisphaera tokodaii TaxID=111955 RepID=F9VNJ5_SULTO|nr:DNA polymerase domain-containing protein [Sulfurisphaera tokodaii]BAK54641.1 DNA polymerase [Sulfurisphaera tokodaii str. 7]HII73097.1 DNA polymerase II [Sulfurisphaera tokodaii]
MEEIVLDAYPTKGGIKLLLNDFRTEFIKTTFPVYVITDNPDIVLQHPEVKYYEKEKWRSLDGKEVELYRFEVESFNAYYYIRKRLKVVNEIPTVLAQTLYRLKIPLVDKIEKVNYATVKFLRWYDGCSDCYEINGERVYNLEDFEADVVECYGFPCKRIRAHVKIQGEKKRSPVSIKGLLEWSYISKTPLHEIAYSTIGKALTTNEAWVALKKRIIIQNIVTRLEKLRKLEDIMRADKGGLFIFPKPGCYEDVYQIDFKSMYPSLIIKYNISAETVDACDDIKTELHSICLKEKGIVPEALEWLVKRKEELKKIDEERAEAIKWILVASFGYLGYRNSRFGKIEAYEMVTYFARKTLRKTVEIAESLGIKVLHGIIDSLIVKGDVLKLIEAVEKETGLKLDYKKFKWVIFTASRNDTPYPTRYIGNKDDGEIIAKGLVRSNMPNIVKSYLNDSLEILSKTKDCNEVKASVKKIKELLDYYKRRVINGEPDDYVIWIKDVPYVRGIKGFYDAREGFKGKDVGYYKAYLERIFEDLTKVIKC